MFFFHSKQFENKVPIAYYVQKQIIIVILSGGHLTNYWVEEGTPTIKIAL